MSPISTGYVYLTVCWLAKPYRHQPIVADWGISMFNVRSRSNSATALLYNTGFLGSRQSQDLENQSERVQ